MTLTPQPGHVFVEYIEPLESRSNLIMPAQVKADEKRTGRIVAVGEPQLLYSDAQDKLEAVPMDLSIGDYVFFKRHVADVLSIGGRTIYSLKQEDVLFSTPDLETFKQLTVVNQ